LRPAILLALLVAASLLVPPAASQEYTVHRLIVPPEFVDGEAYIVVEAEAPYRIVLDANLDGVAGDLEQDIVVSGSGLVRSLLRVEEPGLYQILVNRSGSWAALVYTNLAYNMAAAYSSLAASTTLYAPPLEGALALAAVEGPAEVAVGDARIELAPGETVVLCKPANVTMVEANTSIVGVFYLWDAAGGVAAAVGLASGEDAVRIIGVSSLQISTPAGSEVYALAVPLEGGEPSYYRLERVFYDYLLPEPSIVFIVALGEGWAALDRAVPSGSIPYERGVLFYSRGGGLVLPTYRVVFDSTYAGYAVLVDYDDDGVYEAPLFSYSTANTWVETAGSLAVIARSSSPLVFEYAPGVAVLYRPEARNPYDVTDLDLRRVLDNEYATVQASVVSGGVAAQVTVQPKPGGGPVTQALAAFLTPSLQPVKGTVVKLEIATTSVQGVVPVPLDAYNAGGYIYAILGYYQAVGILTIPLANATEVVEEALPPAVACTASNTTLPAPAVNLAYGEFTRIPNPSTLELGIAEFIQAIGAAVGEPPIAPPATEQPPTQEQTQAPPPLDQPPEEQEAPIPPAPLALALVALAALAVAAIKLNKPSRRG